VRDEESPLFGELDVVANRDITVGELGPYAGVLLRDDEVRSTSILRCTGAQLSCLGRHPNVILSLLLLILTCYIYSLFIFSLLVYVFMTPPGAQPLGEEATVFPAGHALLVFGAFRWRAGRR